MQRRAVRFTLVALLVAAGAAAAIIVWRNERTLAMLDAQRRARELAFERLIPALGSIASAQQAYVDFGLHDDASLARVAALVDRVRTEAAGLRPSGQAPDSSAHLEEFWVALATLTTSADQARERLAAGETLAAADLLLSATRPQVSTLEERLREYRAAEFAGFNAARTDLMRASWSALGAAALLWLAGLILLARVPRPHAVTAAAQAHEAIDSLPAASEPAAAPAPSAPASSAPTINLSDTAELCAAISRLTDGHALNGILERAARIIDARGLIVWMGAGDELFAVAAHGYPESVVSRLPPIKRRADNATAAAWRKGELRVVSADRDTLGAIVVPMFGTTGCIGVLAAEVRDGREADGATRAIAGILAAQLALVLPVWPPSSAETASDAGSDRQAAAS